MATIDWIIILAYFALLLGLTWWVILKNKDTADDYFLAGRNLGWFVVGASIFASNIGSEHLVGLAGLGRTDGVAHGALRAARLVPAGAGVGDRAVLHAVAWSSRCRSSSNGGSRRRPAGCSRSSRWWPTSLTKIAVGIFAGGVVFAYAAAGDAARRRRHELNSFWIGSIAVVVLTGLYTVLGGMRAVAYTDALQTVHPHRRLARW